MNNRPIRLTDALFFLLFCAVLIAIGIMLMNSGYTENPFTSMLAILDVHQALQASPELAIPTATENGVNYFSEIYLASFPDVLYDIWLFFVATAVIILISRPIRWLVQRFS